MRTGNRRTVSGLFSRKASVPTQTGGPTVTHGRNASIGDSCRQEHLHAARLCEGGEGGQGLMGKARQCRP